jgi:hypothetical protein
MYLDPVNQKIFFKIHILPNEIFQETSSVQLNNKFQ